MARIIHLLSFLASRLALLLIPPPHHTQNDLSKLQMGVPPSPLQNLTPHKLHNEIPTPSTSAFSITDDSLPAHSSHKDYS